ncbi:unnamed protein product [Chilo suppressalis]|uniref:Uncharacterized protein n=1 Tax=Chilo suppressalis TaxID=168631 RepID=A0ABN8L7B5_CHISP|nr:unnamed protein product [Chilo suppressalis]
MTSESEIFKTNEFLRRRKLRLQQVREQSKDIAKKLRQRANVEKLQHIEEVNSKKEKEYLKQQEKLVKRLEHLYAHGVISVGASHHKASATKQDVHSTDKQDLSQVRGKEAAAALKKKKQEKLDQQKKFLDRKLLARETANEISREKSSNIANKLIAKSGTSKIPENTSDPTVGESKGNENNITSNILLKNDMATQWDCEELPNEWESNIPLLSLPKDDRESLKESNNIPGSRSEKKKKLDLFALSSEMPSSLRGGLDNVSEERTYVKPSLTMVSEYLQSRALRLREPDLIKKDTVGEDLQSLKRTILNTRSSKHEGSTIYQNVCKVLDEQVIPVPSWHAESTCKFCSHHMSHHSNNYRKYKQFAVTNSEINNIFSSIRPKTRDIQPNPVLRSCSPFRRNKISHRISRDSAKRNIDKSVASSDAESMLQKNNSVMMYNHSTRNSRDVPLGEPDLVVRDHQTEEDAYTKALKETTSHDDAKDKDHLKKLQDMRSKIAMTKHTVEKEYNDTMSFLKSLPKEKCSKHSRISHMDERRQQMVKDKRQSKLQCEFNKIERESRKQCEMNSNSKLTSKNNGTNSKSPAENDINEDFGTRDFQYSWMPVPESDGNLAIHTIPITLKEGKSGNTVKFSKVDSYHEYRSRHKHTPPTKDTDVERPQKQKSVETILIQNDESETIDYSSSSSDTSSVENLNIKKSKDTGNKSNISDEENVVIYKILNSKRGKKEKKRRRLKLIDDVAKVLTAMNKEKLKKDDNNNRGDTASGILTTNTRNSNPLEQINEGLYKLVNEKGDNITSLHFSDNSQVGDRDVDKGQNKLCLCKKSRRINKPVIEGTAIPESGDESLQRNKESLVSKNSSGRSLKPTATTSAGLHTSAATSTSSFKTAAMNEKNTMLDGDFLKVLDDNGHEAGKFYIGASGYLKEDAYEITIQLKKKESTRNDENAESIKKLDENLGLKKSDCTIRGSKIAENVLAPSFEPSHVNHVLNNYETLNTVTSQSAPESDPIVTMPQDQPPPQSTCMEETNLLVNNASNTSFNQPISTASSKQMKDKPVKQVVDRSVYTDSQLSFVVPRDFPKTDVTPRPATSTYTQTSMYSPNTRPVYIHMSSSTSTAYLSPPEMILPKCMRHKHESINAQAAHSSQDERYEIVRQRKCDQDTMCTCRKCVLYKKVTTNKIKANAKSYMKTKHDPRKISTPPNTARNYGNSSLDNNSHDESSRKKLKKCRKCKSRESYSSDINYCVPKVKRANKISSNNLVPNVTRSATRPTNINEKTRKSNLNPIVKKYVNKLLELNSNGLKAIEIANQECSSVSTPGSSVIDVSHNIAGNNTEVNNKISLEQIKMILKQKILEECGNKNEHGDLLHVNKNPSNCISKVPKIKRSVHKVKSLNISRKILKSKKFPVATRKTKPSCSTSSPSPPTNVYVKKYTPSGSKTTGEYSKRVRSKSSPTPRFEGKFESTNDNTASDVSDVQNIYKSSFNKKIPDEKQRFSVKLDDKNVRKANDYILPLHKATITSPDSEENVNKTQTRTDIPTNTSTQTSQDLDSEINLIKMADDKIQNMEKIADLTEKCTKRLSNLAKILEEVRKNKSLAYSHISTSDTASDSEYKSDKVKNVGSTPSLGDPITNAETDSNIQINKTPPHATTLPKSDKKVSSEYISFLKDIPKPDEYKLYSTPVETEKLKTTALSVNQSGIKIRTKPPPALNRISLKHAHDIIPHELSTVVEVDSPMSVKLKNQPSQGDVLDTSISTSKTKNLIEQVDTDIRANPDLLQNNNSVVTQQPTVNIDPADDTKIQMMDLKQFNDVMLKPFITLQEYAKQCNIGILDEGSNMDDNIKDDLANDEFSSLHSDGSLPDVIAELLKRNVIAEPFKFETISNVNSTTVSSESTLSVLALSKVRHNKKKSGVTFQNKENISETSDTLSISSNPDLEKAFKKLGMGWASSTLKKTKEHLALSSSSNTSSSSLLQFKSKNLNSQQIPALVTDSVLSTSKTSKRQNQGNISDLAKNAEQQTFMTSMTVKEFLTNELANKITFTNKSDKNNTDEEFVSLLETQMPEEMKHSSHNLHEERTLDSLRSGSNNRARTSTPVQIFKSMTYHSSSSSNVSNGLFSNADDLSSVKVTSNSMRNHSTSDKGELTIPNCSLKVRKGASDCSKSD